MERRYADQSPAWLIPRLAAIQNLRVLWGEAAKKRADDHAIQMKAMGGESSLGSGDDMPGDIIIQGDTYNVNQLPPKTEPPAVSIPVKPSPPDIQVSPGVPLRHSPIWSFLLGSTLSAGSMALGWYLKPTPPAPTPTAPPAASVDTDTITEFDFP